MLQAIECAVEFWLALEWSPQAQWLLEASETGPLQEEVWPMPTQQVRAHFVTGPRLGRYGFGWRWREAVQIARCSQSPASSVFLQMRLFNGSTAFVAAISMTPPLQAQVNRQSVEVWQFILSRGLWLLQPTCE